ncbi:MAG: M13 family metallopeptidase [Novosphingobium sp.]|nr:M13 family metallopeptidase [Novosphingobium sp.]
MIRNSLRHAVALAAVSASALALASTPALAAEEGSGDWGAFGVQTQWIDTTVKPGDDFDSYVNGVWTRTFEMPADKSRISAFSELDDESQERLKGILEGLVAANPAPGSDGARLAASYKAFMDTDAIEAAGMTPAAPYLRKIWEARTPQDIADLFASPGYSSPLDFDVFADMKNSDVYALYVSSGGLGLPDRDYYLKDTETYRAAREKYREYLTFLLSKAGYEDAKGAADAVFGLETKMARLHWNRASYRQRELTYNKVPLSETASYGKSALLPHMLERLGAKPESVIVYDLPPTAEELKAVGISPADAQGQFGDGTPGMVALIESVPVATWQAWLVTHFLSDNAAVLPKDIDDATFAFYGKALRGQEAQRPRWKRGIDAVEGEIGEILGKVYAEKYYPPAERAAMEQLVTNLRKAMNENLKDLSWMGPQTRKEAVAKLDAFSPRIGAPDTYKTYDGLVLSPTDPLGNAMASNKWGLDFEINRIGKPVDDTEWGILPQTVNATYNSTLNAITFPAAILQPPFFNLTADPAVNYGGIGAVIGHEMGHGFDDQGSKSDGDGNLRDWWTARDKANFQKLQAKLGAQYATFCPFDEGKSCVNPDLTMGENIGDLGGLSLAYRAYRLSLNGKEAPVIDGYTGDQRFFMAWAQVWRSKVRDALAREYLATDPHSPPHYRVNGIVRNFDEWYKAFNVKPGDKLYLPPAQRVRIW